MIVSCHQFWTLTGASASSHALEVTPEVQGGAPPPVEFRSSQPSLSLPTHNADPGGPTPLLFSFPPHMGTVTLAAPLSAKHT